VSHGFLFALAWLERFGRLVENAALVVLLGSLVLLAVGQIVLREIFETGFFRADELIKLIVLWLAMVGSIAATRDNRHIRIDALSHLLPGSVVTAIRLFVDVFAAIVCGIVALIRRYGADQRAGLDRAPGGSGRVCADELPLCRIRYP
jgi:TRAP-type C4-dicarboxylate transport system permease small subunit